MQLLIIEDDERLADLIKRGLEEQDYSVMLAYDGVMGKKMALNNEYDLIITDIILPNRTELICAKKFQC